MTIAAAIHFHDLVEATRVVALFSDSRFTFSSIGRRQDNGAKLWKLGQQVGAVFAGNVGLAEQSLALAQQLIAGLPSLSFDGIEKCAHEAFRRFYHPPLDNLHRVFCVIGAVAPDGAGRVWLISPESGMVPVVETQSVVLIGHPEPRSRLEPNIHEARANPKHLLGPPGTRFLPDGMEFTMHFIAPVAAAFARTIVEGGETVGGRMQAVIIRKDGARLLQGAASTQGDSFVRTTVLPGEVRAHIRESERRQLQFLADLGVTYLSL